MNENTYLTVSEYNTIYKMNLNTISAGHFLTKYCKQNNINIERKKIYDHYNRNEYGTPYKELNSYPVYTFDIYLTRYESIPIA
jgi:hypothetical protein